jgi:pantoate--beta-alanine ligase
MSSPLVLRTVAELRRTVAGWRAAGERVALVPTMGALHPGHVSLAGIGRRTCTRIVVSIFVNPTQFAPNEDFSAYPRTFEADLAALEAERIDAVFAPGVPDMYPDGFCTTVSLAGPAAAGLEDRFRPTHFAGVATVVSKLLIRCLPDVAVFGEKDWQQLAVIRRAARDLDIPVDILGGPTIREADGLAMSSRNVYLTPEERAAAPLLHRVMTRCAERIRAGEPASTAMAEGRAAIEAGGFALDYLETRDPDSLAPVADDASGPLRMLVAARIGRTRLIDNIAVRPVAQH